jgi:hypothetical protein
MQKERVHKELKDIKILLVEDNLINQKNNTADPSAACTQY